MSRSFPSSLQHPTETGALSSVFNHNVTGVSGTLSDGVQIVDRGVVEVKEPEMPAGAEEIRELCIFEQGHFEIVSHCACLPPAGIGRVPAQSRRLLHLTNLERAGRIQ
jgi:hypothetical protein